LPDFGKSLVSGAKAGAAAMDGLKLRFRLRNYSFRRLRQPALHAPHGAG
jgi:hypothetical protein